MHARRGILAGGNWIIDRLKFIDTYPCQDALGNILGESVGNGGSPFNLLIDLAQLGAGFPLLGAGLIGTDPDGEWIIAQCAAHHIDSGQLRAHPTAHTSYTDVMIVRETGRRTFFHQRGANAFLDDPHFDFVSSPARHFHLGYLLLLDRLDRSDTEFGTVAARTLHRAQQAGLSTSVDVVSEDSHRFGSIVLPAMKYVDYCFLNELELERTTGVTVRVPDGVDVAAIEAAARRLLDAGVREWVIVHFSEGACALGRDGRLRIQGSVKVPDTQIVSAVGAGDAFAAGVLYALHDSAPIETGLLYGVCAAAACLKGTGASDGVRPLREVVQMAQRWGVRSLT